MSTKELQEYIYKLKGISSYRMILGQKENRTNYEELLLTGLSKEYDLVKTILSCLELDTVEENKKKGD